MNAITPRKNSFGRYDRIIIGKAVYRYLRTDEDGAHQLQVCKDGLLEDAYLRITDAKIAELMRRRNFKVEPAYFSKALDELRARHDSTDLLALSEEDARTVFWKLEWCIRFHDARTSPRSGFRPTMTPKDLQTFIDNEKVAMNRWYIRRFNEPRPLGRPVVVGIDENGEEIREAKPFDYPSSTALRNWLRLYARTGERMAAFAPRYYRSGNRKQLDTEYSRIIDECVLHYADRSQPTRKDILDRVEVELHRLRKRRKEPFKLVSQSTVDRRIAKLEPFHVMAGRLGEDRALRKFLLVGRGPEALYPLHRVEMDDWEADLMTLLIDSGTWELMDERQRAQVKRVRCTVTIAIDVKTRCVVGFNVSETAPSTPGAKAGLRSITEDKTRLARYAGVEEATWEMCGRPDGLFTDGGPVFQGEFKEAAKHCGMDVTRPDADPRMRGHVEVFFRYLRRFCRFFTGQTFSDVVKKGDYDAEGLASLTVEEFRKALIKFIVEVYHNSPRRPLLGMTPRQAWARYTEDHQPAEVTPAQRLYAFGFKEHNVSLDNQGVLHLNISYSSAALGEIWTKFANGRPLKERRAVKVDLVIDPGDLGHVFVHVPRQLIPHMQSNFPAQMHGEFLDVPALDRRNVGRTLAKHLLENEGIRKFVWEQRDLKGEIIRIEANESLTELGRRAAVRAGVATHLLTAKDYERLVKKFRRKAAHVTEGDPIGDDPSTAGPAHGTVVAAGRRKGPKPEPPAPLDPFETAVEPATLPAPDEAAPPAEDTIHNEVQPEEAPPDPDDPKPAPAQPVRPARRDMPRPSRGINDGDDD